MILAVIAAVVLIDGTEVPRNAPSARKRLAQAQSNPNTDNRPDGQEPASSASTTHVIVAVGAAGTAEFGEAFADWSSRWEAASRKGSARATLVGTTKGDKPDRELLQTAIAEVPKTAKLWLVLIGHGTYDKRAARFNLRGPDVTARELDAWLDKLDVPTAIINCASSSAPFINACSGKERIVVTATKSGVEQSYARFGDYLSQVIGDPSVDLDKDGQTSLLEAWLIASRRTQDFYSENGRLATEHALLDDNGDERGTRYDAFRGIHPAVKNALDGSIAHRWHLVPSESERRIPENLATQRDELEGAIKRLRENRSNLREDEYYARLEVLMVPLATIYADIERTPAK